MCLVYHGFSVERRVSDPDALFVTEDRLRSQVKLLERLGRRPIGLSAYLSGEARKSDYLFTIDDGYRSVLEIAAPLLRKCGIRAVLFVPPHLMGRTTGGPEPFLDAPGLRALRTTFEFDIGVHGFDHRPMEGLSADELRRQTSEAREQVADLAGALPRVFAYPYGRFDDASRAAVAAAGFEAAFAVDRDEGRFAIGRTGIYAKDSLPLFMARLAMAGPRSAGFRYQVRRLRRSLRP